MMTNKANSTKSIYLMPSGLLKVDQHLTITEANQKATNIASTRGQSLLGSNVLNVFPMLASHELILRHTLSTSQSLAINCTQTLPFATRYFRVSCSVAADDENSRTIRIDHLAKPVVKARRAHARHPSLALLQLVIPSLPK